jgi:hypothetical protein
VNGQRGFQFLTVAHATGGTVTILLVAWLKDEEDKSARVLAKSGTGKPAGDATASCGLSPPRLICCARDFSPRCPEIPSPNSKSTQSRTADKQR